ncbi:sulfatase [Haloferula rosea]|uniref:Sulfatase n=1 Tax=Haloferula rosea TaxID=490093 RepID=A0A934VHA1_9BACT|nr:sulfatase [Haloferula rosea]MBK1828857.1 sulfatase [Haloferula rosea]
MLRPIILSAVLAVPALLQGADTASKPNIVFILADDLGWSDTTIYGHTKLYETPHIERLAKRGMRFTRAYSDSPLCSPTRSAILTGLSPARTGLTTPNCHMPKVVLKASPGTKSAPGNKSVGPNPVTRLDTKYQTLPKTLKAAGYATGHFGKWHLGTKPYSPLEHGFDVDIPHWPGPGPAGSFVAPWKFKNFDPDPDVPNQHIEDRMATEAVAFMEKHKDEPFFLNYWMFSVHAPFDAKAELIRKYRDKIDPNDPQRSAIYAAMIESMDDAVGTLLDALDRLGIADNTIVVFFSDNGGNMYNDVEGTTPTSNAPLRGGKANVYEGGVRVPCIVSWPDLVKPATTSNEIIQGCDFYPTFIEGLGLKPEPDQQFDGVNILPALKGGSLDREAIFSYFPHSPPIPGWLPPSVTVWKGDWKLIRLFHQGENGSHRWKLYNLRDDIGEKNDRSSQEPERVQELDKMIGDFLDDTNAVTPVPNPNFKPSAYQPEREGVGKLKPTQNPAAARQKKKPTPPKAKTPPGS